MKKLMALNLMLILILVACSSPTPVTLTEASTALPTPTLEPTNTPIPVSPFRSFPRVNCCKDRMVEPGEYELPSWMETPLTIEVSRGWGVLNEERALLFLLAGKGRNPFNDPSQVLVFVPVSDEDPQTILTSIRNSPELTPLSEITETTIAGRSGGLAGWQFDATAKPNPENNGSQAQSIPAGAQYLPAVNKYFAPGFLWTTWTAEPRLRFMALNVGRHVLLFEIEAPSAEFESFASEVDKVLQTLKLRR